MSGQVWLIADTHFGHEKTWKEFTREDGSPLRPFSSTEEMDETIVSRWNSVVRPRDRVYVMGDVVFKRAHLPILGKLTGRLMLVKGNHDIFSLKDYSVYFDDVVAYKFLDDMILSHIPIHPDHLRRPTNVHGHLHDRVQMKVIDDPTTWGRNKASVPDPRYVCVSVEQIDYTPVNIEQIRERIKRANEGESDAHI